MPRMDGPFEVLRRINNNAYKLDLQGKYTISSTFNIADLVPFVADITDLRSNPLQVGGDDTSRAKEKELDELALEPDRREIKEDGPMTRARTKRHREMVVAFVKKLDPKEDKKEEAQSVLVCLSALEEFGPTNL